jgi:hypothetical protein
LKPPPIVNLPPSYEAIVGSVGKTVSAREARLTKIEGEGLHHGSWTLWVAKVPEYMWRGLLSFVLPFWTLFFRGVMNERKRK